MRWSAVLALALGAILIVLFAGRAELLVDEADPTRFWGTLLNGLLALPAFAAGPLLALRVPRNAIGWLFCVWGVVALGGPFLRLVIGEVVGREWQGALATSGLTVTLFLLALLIFPTGRLLSWRWSPAILVAVSPLFLSPLFLQSATFGATMLLAVLALASTLLRFTRAAGPERQQLKWFGYAVLLVLVFLGLNTVLDCNGLLRLGGQCRLPIVADAMWGLTFAAPPIAMTLAILRYRLYDIDTVINRTLVYVATTVALAAVFGMLQIVLQILLRSVTEGSSLAVAVATLLIAALFVPLRDRIQQGVDRRFYRSRYDARRTLDAFVARLRDQTELETVRAELLAVVRETVQPTRVELWLRPRGKVATPSRRSPAGLSSV